MKKRRFARLRKALYRRKAVAYKRSIQRRNAIYRKKIISLHRKKTAMKRKTMS